MSKISLKPASPVRHFQRVLAFSIIFPSYFSSLAQDTKKSADLLFHRAYYFLSIDTNKAIDLLDQCIQQDSTFKDAYFHRGIAYFKLAEYEKSLTDFNKAQALDPELHIIWMYKGFANRNLGLLDKALTNFSNYIIHNPTDTTAYSYILRGKMKYELGDFDGAVEDYDMAVKLRPFQEKYHYYRFIALYEAKKYDEALQAASSLIEITPDFYGYYFYKGNVYHDLQFYDSAIYMYNIAIIKNYQNADSYFYRGQSYQAKKELKKALEDYNTAIILKDSDGSYFSARGNCKFDMNDKKGACDDWDIAGGLGYYEDFDKVKRICDSQ
ncbi:tetratricopeptide repeat protein [Fulvivirga sp. M361]|uniref:tetratricopeptide repeat protein n=1 Tax=Fulvivirga sp. M361 TaxID=2594266 RepID=UPI00117B9EA7|nr:tetratricopeptide repeat protein [Fulvivirga sp. M361]TRX52652.1 tetratricopeptide repeat protein [Fulvivirga sp. M361]